MRLFVANLAPVRQIGIEIIKGLGTFGAFHTNAMLYQHVAHQRSLCRCDKCLFTVVTLETLPFMNTFLMFFSPLDFNESFLTAVILTHLTRCSGNLKINIPHP